MAADIIKVANPKHILEYISRTLGAIHSKVAQRTRYSVFVESPQGASLQMDKYLEMLLNTKEGSEVETIDIEGFMPSRVKTYFPNFKNGAVFEAFPVPYLERESPAVTLLGSMIHESIRKHKKVGGVLRVQGGVGGLLEGQLSPVPATRGTLQEG